MEKTKKIKFHSKQNLLSFNDYINSNTKLLSLGQYITKYFSKNKLEEIFKENAKVKIYSRTLENISMLEFRNLVVEPEVRLQDSNNFSASIKRRWNMDSLINSNMKIFFIILSLVLFIMGICVMIIFLEI